MTGVFAYLATSPELLLFLVVGVGALLGHFSIRGVSLGPAAVLFVGIGLAAWATSMNQPLEIPAVIGHVGLALFTFSVGVSSGANFFHTMRNSAKAVVPVIVAIVAAAGVAFALGPVFGLNSAEVAGTFAGAVTNTPALAAAGNSAETGVGYSVAYLFGVVGMLGMTMFALYKGRDDLDAPSPLTQADIRIVKLPLTTVHDFESDYDNQIHVTRVRRTEDGPVELATARLLLEPGQVITVVGVSELIDRVSDDVGHRSSHHLTENRRDLDSRRITVSSGELVGRPLRDLELEERFQATISRVRRADVDLVAQPGMLLQLGDRVRVVAPAPLIPKISEYFGDSSRGLTAVNPIALGLGMAVGILLGSVPLPLPGGATFVLGMALGALLVGLIMGRLVRVGSMSISLPFTTTTVIAEVGLLLFLAQAGVRSGGMILTAFSSGQWLGMLALGVSITVTIGGVVFAIERYVMSMGGTRLAGVVAGTQTQPALLAYANQVTNHDFRVNEGYSMAYPFAMITKIVAASVLAILV